MNLAVITAWHDSGSRDRLVSRNWTDRYWRSLFPDATFVVGRPEPFSRASALNVAIRGIIQRERSFRHDPPDVFLQADPDSFVPRAQALAAVEQAAEADGLVVAFDRYVYLAARPSAAVIAQRPWEFDGIVTPGGETEFEGHGGVGNVVAFSRRTWEAVGGFDERFDAMWGGDDGAFAYATGTLVAPVRRIDGPMSHLWHPRQPQSQPGHPEYLRQFDLVARYRDAAGDGEAMRALIERL